MAMLPRHAALFLLPLVLAQGPAHLRAQASGPWSGCKTDSLSNWNCAHYYSGTVSYSSELKTADGTESRSITATVAGGKVTCKVKSPEAAGLRRARHAGRRAREHPAPPAASTPSRSGARKPPGSAQPARDSPIDRHLRAAGGGLCARSRARMRTIIPMLIRRMGSVEPKRLPGSSGGRGCTLRVPPG